MSDRIENTGGVTNTYNKAEIAKGREAKKPKLGVWAGVMPKETLDNMPKPLPVATLKPWTQKFYEPGKDFLERYLWKSGSRVLQFYAVDRPRSTDLFGKTLDSFTRTAGASPSVIMGYMQWHDGWDYQPFPKLFGDLCYEKGATPMITWQPSFKRKYAGSAGSIYFLDEFNAEISNKKSELYRYVVEFAKDAKNWTEKHGDQRIYIRPFHEMNLDFAYDWTGYMNGEQAGPEKLKTAWKSLRDIFREVKADNVKFIWCPEAHPDAESNPKVGEKWNSFESYYPGDKYVDVIGFDVYQKKPGTDFNALFKDASGFIAKHPGVPAGICEASTYPEYYRVKFIEDLFKSAEKTGLEFVVWFNENKQGTGEGEENWSITAKITPLKQEEKQAEAESILKGFFEEPAQKEVKKETKDGTSPSEGLIAFRKAIGASENPNYRGKDDAKLLQEVFKLEKGSNPQSYNKAVEESGKKKLKDEQKTVIKLYPYLEKYNAIGNGPAAKLNLAKVYIEKWLSSPAKYNSDLNHISDFQTALDILEKNIAGPEERATARFYSPENLLSLVEKVRVLMKYNEMFLNETEDAKIRYPAIKEAEMVCGSIESLLKDKDGYIKEVNRRKKSFDKEQILGTEASILVFRGDIYMDEGNKDLNKAKGYYKAALAKVEEKDKWSGVKERYLNRSAKMGLCRANGLSATTKKELDAAVAELANIINDKEKYDPGLKIKAKFYLGELLKHYYDLYDPDRKTSEVSKEEAAAKIRQAYAVYGELKNTELAYLAGKKMKELKSTDASLNTGTKITQ